MYTFARQSIFSDIWLSRATLEKNEKPLAVLPELASAMHILAVRDTRAQI